MITLNSPSTFNQTPIISTIPKPTFDPPFFIEIGHNLLSVLFEGGKHSILFLIKFPRKFLDWNKMR